MKTLEPLPKSLRYLQPFVNFLAKLPADELNEDVDASKLEAALRKRLKGLDEEAAEDLLVSDRDALKSWLKEFDSQTHPAHWILGWLSLPDLASLIVRPSESPRRGPKIQIEVPKGWKTKESPFQFHLKKGPVFAVITAVKESSIRVTNLGHERWKARPDMQATLETFAVEFGRCVGKKFLYMQSMPFFWKEVDYTLSVPGGLVQVHMGAKGKNFDEYVLESVLQTLELSGSMDV